MHTTYLLKINTANLAAVEQALGIVSVASRDQPWTVLVDSNQSFKGISHVDDLLTMIEGKESALAEIINDIDEAISLWVLYEYEQQCNLEFSPQELKKLSANNVSLCISCWQK